MLHKIDFTERERERETEREIVMASSTRSSKIEDRVLAVEAAIQGFNEKLKKFEVLESSIDDVKSSAAARDVVRADLEERLGKVEEQLGELASKIEAMILVHDKEWPALERKEDEGFTVVESKKGRRDKRSSVNEVQGKSPVVVPKTSLAQKLGQSKRKVVVAGDSLARGVGHKLKEQCGDMINVRAESGAKLGAVSNFVESLDKDENRQLVVVAGANSLEKESSVELLSNYRKTIDAGKKSCKDVVMVGLVKRYDLSQTYESKRIVVNTKLKALCRDSGVKFVEYEPERSRVHRDGLHLNFRGQNELGRMIFPFVRNFLV